MPDDTTNQTTEAATATTEAATATTEAATATTEAATDEEPHTLLALLETAATKTYGALHDDVATAISTASCAVDDLEIDWEEAVNAVEDALRGAYETVHAELAGILARIRGAL